MTVETRAMASRPLISLFLMVIKLRMRSWEEITPNWPLWPLWSYSLFYRFFSSLINNQPTKCADRDFKHKHVIFFQYVHDPNKCSLLLAGSLFVIASAKFIPVGIQPIDAMDAATAHRVAWNANEQCFLFKLESNRDEFFTTLSLSHRIFVLSSTGTPNIRNLNRNAVMCSMHVFRAINSDEKALLSTVFWRLL